MSGGPIDTFNRLMDGVTQIYDGIADRRGEPLECRARYGAEANSKVKLMMKEVKALQAETSLSSWASVMWELEEVRNAIYTECLDFHGYKPYKPRTTEPIVGPFEMPTTKETTMPVDWPYPPHNTTYPPRPPHKENNMDFTTNSVKVKAGVVGQIINRATGDIVWESIPQSTGKKKSALTKALDAAEKKLAQVSTDLFN